jgi:hypothetical protein
MSRSLSIQKSLAFKEFLHPLSVLPNSTAIWHMRVIYTTEGVMEMLCALYISSFAVFAMPSDDGQ